MSTIKTPPKDLSKLLTERADALVAKMNAPGAAEAMENALFSDTQDLNRSFEDAMREIARISKEMGLYDLEQNPLIKDPDGIRYQPEKK